MELHEYENLREWFAANLAESASDLAQFGAQGGFPGITYYSETGALYEAFEDDIWEMLEQDAAEFGADNVMAHIGTFHGAKDVHSDAQFRNLLVWYACERIAQDIAEQ